MADRCNGMKSDHLAAATHLQRWWERSRRCSADLRDLAGATSWTSDAPRSIALVRSTYLHLPPSAPLWRAADEFDDADPTELARILVG